LPVLDPQRNPTQETFSELDRVESGKYAPKGIVGWNVIGQVEKLTQPSLLLYAKTLNTGLSFRTGYNAT
jgi:hypothetical protein